jgi:general stress protein 26
MDNAVPLKDLASPKAMEFLQSHSTCVISTVNDIGKVFGAAMHYAVFEDKLFLITKQGTTKARNIREHPQVAITVYDDLQTIQMQGVADIETDKDIMERVHTELTKRRKYGSGVQLPPITELNEGHYLAIGITPFTLNYSDYER